MKYRFNKTNLLMVLVLSGICTSVFANPDGCLLKMPDESKPMGMLVAMNDSNPRQEQNVSLYTRLGGYDAISAVVDDLVQRLAADPKLGRFWAHRGTDGIKREKQLVVDFIVNQAGGPLNYGGRDMVTSHKGMKISNDDWNIFIGHLNETLVKFNVPSTEKTDTVNFIDGLKVTIVEKP